MIPPPFDHVRAGSTDEAVRLLAEHGEDAKLLAGGQSLIPLLKMRLAEPTVLIDLGKVGDLAYVREDGDVLAIGAMTRHRTLERDGVVAARTPLLGHAAGQVGDRQVRSQGTIGGSVSHADPAADYPAVLTALGAELVLRGPGGERRVAAADFFVGFLETALQGGELLTEIRVPVHEAFGYAKFRRRANDWATVGAAVARTNGSTGVALMNMGQTPVRAAAVEAALANGASGADAAQLAAEGTSPTADAHASRDYRRHLATVMVRRALDQAAGSE